MSHPPSMDLPAYVQRRRLSADLGGLRLAVENGQHGHGWIGVSGGPSCAALETRFAELLGDLHTQTLQAVNEHGGHFKPANLPIKTRRRLVIALESWNFEPHKLSDDEVFFCALILFEALFRIDGMEQATSISLEQISPFVFHLRHIYRLENTYHNFEHAVDVLQAIHTYFRSANMVPPLSILLEPKRTWSRQVVSHSQHTQPLLASLDLLDLFLVHCAAIGHDVGHPGLTNLFMKNAETPLSVVFDGKSALEHMHCQFLLRVMRYHGMGTLLDHPQNGSHVRRILCETVLATDMSVHAKFMNDFQALLNGEVRPLLYRQILVCQAIMKCADISNPSRPYPISKHWAGALMEEWSSQALFEKYLRLPTTVQSFETPLNIAKSQVFFISTFAKPLLDLTVRAIPEMKPFANQCYSNLGIWNVRVKQLESSEKIVTSHIAAPPRHLEEFVTAFPLTLPQASASTSPQQEGVPSPSVGPTTTTMAEDVGIGSRMIWSPLTAQAYRDGHGRSTSGSSSSQPSSSVVCGYDSGSHPCSPSISISTSPSLSLCSPVDTGLAEISPTPCQPSSRANNIPPLLRASGTQTLNSMNPNMQTNDHDHAAVRTAGKVGIRKQRSANRNSCPPSALCSIAKSASESTETMRMTTTSASANFAAVTTTNGKGRSSSTHRDRDPGPNLGS